MAIISIYTRTNNLFSKERIKWEFKRVLRKKDGPQMVLDSIKSGLESLKVPFAINPKIPTQTVHIVSGIECLKEAIRWKKDAKIKKLIVGPNIVVSPKDHGGILDSKEIDIILQPSQWVKNFYTSLCPQLESKIKIWPAGSEIPLSQTIKQNFCIIYNKNYRKETIEGLKNILKEKKIGFKILNYGEFKQEKFHKLLYKSSLMIYLSRSESQGLALQEAWVRNVPTLILESKNALIKDKIWEDEKINAPYLEDNFGYFFNIENFSNNIDKVLYLNPRAKAIEKFSNRVTIEKYLNLIE